MVRHWGKVENCCQFSCSTKKTVAHAVNSLIDVNWSHRIFHNFSSESVINSEKKKTFRRVSINEETTTQERKAQNLTFPVFSTLSGDHLLLAGILLLIRSVFCQSDPIRSGPVRSDPIRSRFSNGRKGLQHLFQHPFDFVKQGC